MPVFLDTRGHTDLSIAICARCGIKHARDELMDDPNYPGLKVCKDDRDQFDPYRLPARVTENISLEWSRPDVNLSVGPEFIPIKQLQAVLGTDTGVEIVTDQSEGIAIAAPVTQINPSVPWTASTGYPLGASVTNGNPVGPNAAGNLFCVFVCIVPGESGEVAPNWNNATGSETYDGTAIWINQGLYLP